MIKSVCSQTSDSDSVILKQKLLYEYEKIDSIYFHKPVKQIKWDIVKNVVLQMQMMQSSAENVEIDLKQVVVI